MCCLFSEVLPSNLSPLVLFVTLLERCSFWFRWRLLVAWVSWRLSLLRSLLPVRISSLRIFRSFELSQESEARPLPRFFRVRSLADFVGALPNELLLCPVRALCCYLSRTSSLPSRPRSLFVSPLTPSCPLSKNTLSFFIRDVIAKSYSTTGLSPLSVSSSSAVSSLSSSHPQSSVRAHGVHGVTSSWAFLRNASLSSVLEVATWSSASVFTSFYLSDVRFSSSAGFALGHGGGCGSCGLGVLFVRCCLDRLSSCFSLLLQLG